MLWLEGDIMEIIDTEKDTKTNEEKFYIIKVLERFFGTLIDDLTSGHTYSYKINEKDLEEVRDHPTDKAIFIVFEKDDKDNYLSKMIIACRVEIIEDRLLCEKVAFTNKKLNVDSLCST